jgi:hypothetical protein
VVLDIVCLRALAGQIAPSTVVSSKPRTSLDVQVSDKNKEVWADTTLELKPGERAVFTAKGTARCPGQQTEFGPEGLARGFRDLLRVLPVNQAGRGALIGRIGDKDVALPFVVGESREVVAPVGGLLALGINRTDSDSCGAVYSVHVDVYPPADTAGLVVAKRVQSLDGVDRALFGKIPRRVSDNLGNPGDMVNFLILGSQAGMERVFKTAGWVEVDPDVKGALISGVISSLSKEAYLTLPMSQLYLFDRPQDYGWAHAEPIRVAASRHHLRVWQAPFKVADSTLWVGAATHDIGFERDRRNNGVTHKIDPNVDLEREYVERTLTGTGLVSEMTYVLPENPLREAKTATGGSFQSDGQLLVLKLQEAAVDPSRNATNR